MLAEQGYILSELDRRLTQMIRIGVIQEVDLAKAKVKVKIGDNVTDWRPWLTQAGRIKTWNPPVIGEQVLVLSPSGDFEQSVILPSLYYQKFKAPSDQNEEVRIDLSENSRLVWNAEKDHLQLHLSKEGVFEVEIDDRSVIFEKEAFTLTQKETEVHIEDNHIGLKNHDKRLDLDKDGVQITTSNASFSLKNGVITLQAGPQTLQLRPEGLYLNGFPVA